MKQIENALKACKSKYQQELLQTATTAALKAGSIIRNLYEKPHNIKFKGSIDLVTEADLAAESAILSILQKDFPGLPYLAEESSNKIEKLEHEKCFWIIDPLDGTTNFAHGLPFFGVSIALWDDKSPQIGIIYCPMQDEFFCAIKDGGAWINNKKINVTKTDKLIESLLATGFPYDIHSHLAKTLQQLQNVLPQVRDIRRCGAAAVDLAYLACGRIDGFWEIDLKPWDTAAAMLLVEEAGGVLSNFAGKPFSPFIPEIIASNSCIHDKLVDLLR